MFFPKKASRKLPESRILPLLKWQLTVAVEAVPIHEEEAHGFHLGSELESRSLTGYPDVSPLFNQPVLATDLLPTSRQFHPNSLVSIPANNYLYNYNKNTAQLAAVPRQFIPSRTVASQPINNQLIRAQHDAPLSQPLAEFPTGDYSNPLFRPIYARPPAPPAQYATKKSQPQSLCDCSCTSSSFVTTAAPAIATIIETTGKGKLATKNDFFEPNSFSQTNYLLILKSKFDSRKSIHTGLRRKNEKKEFF